MIRGHAYRRLAVPPQQETSPLFFATKPHMLATTACLPCRQHRRECDRALPACGPCGSFRAEGEFGDGGRRGCRYHAASIQNQVNAWCFRCASHAKKCDQMQPTCRRCLESGASCVYFPPSSPSPPVPISPETTPTPQSSTYVKNSTVTALVQMMDFSTEADLEPEPPYLNQLIDADLAPTFDDYILVRRYLFSSHPVDFGTVSDLDPEAFLSRFFLEPPPLRLVLGCYAANLFRSELPPHVPFLYVKRAHKAVLRFMDKPSLRMCQALLLFLYILQASGQIAFANLVFEKCVQLMLYLKFDYDPETVYPDYPDYVKEEMRALYWRVITWARREYIVIIQECASLCAGNLLTNLHSSTNIRHLPLCF
ncbi:hypothetical protein BC830DRAFT_911665 [Chytriomyces sp. MP71]|nr:hypothetical protein BC830DRAFT_911665 [Chytriomyces sp. MP71]